MSVPADAGGHGKECVESGNVTGTPRGAVPRPSPVCGSLSPCARRSPVILKLLGSLRFLPGHQAKQLTV